MTLGRILWIISDQVEEAHHLNDSDKFATRLVEVTAGEKNDGSGSYPLVNIQKAMENHHLQ